MIPKKDAPMKRFPLKNALPAAAILFAAAAATALPSCEKADPGCRLTDMQPFAPTLESMEEHFQMPHWYKDAKFGVFTHLIPKPGAPVVVTDLDAPVKSVKLFGSEKPVKWASENGVLTITAPEAEPALKISLCCEVEFERK